MRIARSSHDTSNFIGPDSGCILLGAIHLEELLIVSPSQVSSEERGWLRPLHGVSTPA